MILLSIILPIYKVEKYIGDCLDSITRNITRHKDVEIVLVNDGTPDHSMDIVSSYYPIFANVKVINQKNAGLSSARMSGFQNSTGAYVWFVDTDDWISNTAVETIFDTISKNPGIDLIMSPLLWTGDTDEKKDYFLSDNIITDGKTVLYGKNLPVWASQRFIIRRPLFNYKELYFPENLIHEDEYFNRILLYKASTVFILKDPIYYYRQRAGSIINSNNIRSSYNLISIFKLLDSFNTRIVDAKEQIQFKNCCMELLTLSYKRSAEIFCSREFRKFRKENWSYIMHQSMKSPLYNLKEKIWLALYYTFPYLHTTICKMKYKLR